MSKSPICGFAFVLRGCLAVGLVGLSLACIPPATFSSASARPNRAGGTALVIVPPGNVVFDDYRTTFEGKYPQVELFGQEFARAVAARLGPAGAGPGRVEIDEIRLGNASRMGFFLPLPGGPAIDLGKTYCSVRITYRILDGAGAPVFEGQLAAASSEGHPLFSREKRMTAALGLAEERLADLLAGRWAPAAGAARAD